MGHIEAVLFDHLVEMAAALLVNTKTMSLLIWITSKGLQDRAVGTGTGKRRLQTPVRRGLGRDRATLNRNPAVSAIQPSYPRDLQAVAANTVLTKMVKGAAVEIPSRINGLA